MGGWPRRHGVALGRTLALCGRTLAGLGTFAVAVGIVLISYASLTFFAVVTLVVLGRALAVLARRLAGRWSGVEIPVPYRPVPQLQRTPNGWYWTGVKLR